jgi:hypothetical protein
VEVKKDKLCTTASSARRWGAVGFPTISLGIFRGKTEKERKKKGIVKTLAHFNALTVFGLQNCSWKKKYLVHKLVHKLYFYIGISLYILTKGTSPPLVHPSTSNSFFTFFARYTIWQWAIENVTISRTSFLLLLLQCRHLQIASCF